MNPRSANRRTLVLLGLCFAAPMLIALLLAKSGWMPTGRKNYGELLATPVSLQDATLVDGTAFAWKMPPAWYWTLLVRVPESCAGSCRERLDLVSNLREALARDATKLRIAIADPLPADARLAGEHGVYVLAAPVPRSIEDALPRPAAAPLLALVDPNGYVILRYREDADFGKVRKDLAKLLK
jgi:hypothetical protein